MYSTSSTDKLYSQLTALTSDKKHFMQIIDTVPTLSQAKSISCRQFAHMQSTYVSQKHLLQSVCTLAARLRRAKEFACQFVHLQPTYVRQKHLFQSVCTLAARLRRTKAFRAGTSALSLEKRYCGQTEHKFELAMLIICGE